MGRSVWFLVGAGVGVYATLRGQRELKKLTPERIGELVGRRMIDSRERVAERAGRFFTGARIGAGDRVEEMQRVDELTIRQPAVDPAEPLGQPPRRVRR